MVVPCDKESVDDLLTASMQHEEKILHDEGQKQEEELKELALAKFKESSMDAKLSQLNHLLEKSSIYANYLLEILEVRKKTTQEKAAKKSKKSSKNKIAVKENNQEINSKSTGYNTRKRKVPNGSVASKQQKKKSKDRKGVSDNFNPQVKVERCSENGKELVSGNTTVLSASRQNGINGAKLLVHEAELLKESPIADKRSEKENALPLTSMRSSVSNKVDKNVLLEAKFHQGSELCRDYKLVDGERYFKGQNIPDAQPEFLTGGILRDYQLTGLQWLKVLFDNAVNGILADEMGLGKTVQCIAMVCRLLKTGFQGPFLVCAPLSTVCNWVLEFKAFAPQIPVLLYHGTAAERSILQTVISERVSRLNCFPVVITSYEVLMRDRPKLARHAWDYLIVDEGHRLKNINCRLLKELKALTVTAKVLLTGTPLQNNLTELWSLLNFLLPEVFNDLNSFEEWFDLDEIQKHARAVSLEKEEHIIVMLHKILAPFLLRRIKSDIDIELPPKRELLLFVPLVPSQGKFYQAIANKTINKLLKKNDDCCKINIFDLAAENLSANGADKKPLTRSSTVDLRISLERKANESMDDDFVVNVSLNNLMMQLRKCCNHPYLIKYPLIPGTDIFQVDEKLINSCGKLQLLDQMLPVLLQKNHKLLIFSQMTKILDILEDFCQFRSYKYFRLDGQTKCENRQQYIDAFNNDSDTFLFLLSTRAGGLGINLTAADTVIIYDSDWNPQNDLQAQDRCHRIGQTRPVIVYRLVAANTVDQFMVQRAEAKRVLERLVINQKKFKGKLDEDLQSHSSHTVESGTLLSMLKKFGTVSVTSEINGQELNKILDRQFVMTCTDNDISCGVFQNIQ